MIEHNILEDPLDVLRPGSFDLVCSRLMLFHLKGRQEQAIRQMAECLRPGGWLLDEDADWGTASPVDPTHPLYDDYQRVWRDGDWWVPRGYDKAFGQKLPALFERCGLEDIRNEASTEVVRGGSLWARWWIPTLEVINELGGGDEASQREVQVMTAALADPTSGFRGSYYTRAGAEEAATPPRRWWRKQDTGWSRSVRGHKMSGVGLTIPRRRPATSGVTGRGDGRQRRSREVRMARRAVRVDLVGRRLSGLVGADLTGTYPGSRGEIGGSRANEGDVDYSRRPLPKRDRAACTAGLSCDVAEAHPMGVG